MEQQDETQKRNATVKAYQHLVEKTAGSLMRRFSLKPAIYDDLISAGFLGLIEGITNCRSTKPTTVNRYLQVRVRGSMLDTLRESSVLSRKACKFVKAMSAMQYLAEEEIAQEEASQSANRSSNDLELAKTLDLVARGALGIRLTEIQAREELGKLKSTEPLPDKELSRKQERQRLQDAIDNLPEKERIIINSYYFEDKSFIAIANENSGMSKSWISRLHSRALDNLREQLNEKVSTN